MTDTAFMPVCAPVLAETQSRDAEPPKIYIVLSQTGTVLSRILKLYTHAPYNHASIALTADLDVMYSFGRLDPYNPFVGGFVQESHAFGTFKRFKNTRVIVVEAVVTPDAYEKLRARLYSMLRRRTEYHYNYLGLFLAPFRIHRVKRNCYYCSEFVKAMAVQAGVEGAETIPAIVKPMHLLQVPHRTVFEGRLRDYPLLRTFKAATASR